MSTSQQKKMSLIINILVVLVLFFGAAFYLKAKISDVNRVREDPLQLEFNWYKNNGYSPYKLDYTDVLDCLPPAYVDEISVSKNSLRQKASDMKLQHGEVIISLCSDEKFICVVGDYTPDTGRVKIYFWEP